MWAEDLGGHRYRLWNNPFDVRGYSYHDVAEARPHPAEPGPVVRRRVLRSLHSTFWCKVHDGIRGNPRFDALWAPLQALGCAYENADGRVLSVDVPPDVPCQTLTRRLLAGVLAGVWEYGWLDLAPELRGDQAVPEEAGVSG